jgi:hypothetical protein
MKFTVLRAHHGDKDYLPGDVRDAKEAEVMHLVDRGVLTPNRAKAAPAAKTKVEPRRANKADQV